MISSHSFLKKTEALSFYSSGRNSIARGKFDEGAEQLKKAISHGENTIDLEDAYTRLVFVTMGKEENESLLYEALNSFPESPTLHIQKMVIDSLDPDSTVSQNAQVRLDTFKTSESHLEIKVAQSLSISLKTKETIVTVRREIAGLYHNFGNGLFGREKFRKAALAFRRALEFDSNRLNTWQNLIGALAKAGLASEAVSVAHQATGRNPQAPSFGLFYNASVALAASGQIGDAIVMARRALGNNPTAKDSGSIFSLYLHILDDNPGPASSEDCVRMGLDLWGGGRTEDSKTAFRLALEKDRTNARAQFGLGLSFLTMGKVVEADSLYAQGLLKFGRPEAEKAGAPGRIRDLIAQGVQVEAARKILSTYFPK